MPKTTSRKRSHAGITSSSVAAAGGNERARKRAATNGTGSNQHNNLITPNTTLGQHFLKNPAVITSIVSKAGLKSTDTVLEIGPGTGNMTVQILDKCQKLIALEYDSRMVREVLKRVEQMPSAKNKLQIIQGDAVKTQWPFFDVMIANLPYQISSVIVFKLLSHRPMFRCAVLMFQEEFALRLSAKPGDNLYCRLSVNTQLLAKVHQLMKIGKNNFRPPPKVESRLVRIELHNPPPPVNFTEWDGMIRLLFNRKNKTLRSVLMTKTVLKMLEENRKTVQSLQQNDDKNKDDDRTVAQILEDILGQEVWKGKRASKLDLDDFLQLLAEFNTAGIHFS